MESVEIMESGVQRDSAAVVMASGEWLSETSGRLNPQLKRCAVEFRELAAAQAVNLLMDHVHHQGALSCTLPVKLRYRLLTSLRATTNRQC